ncbi:hypothetical protein Tco_1160912, partial [Tanacetum coccineum]
MEVDTRVWKLVRYGVSKELDMAYWGFLGVGTTFDIFQNIRILYIKYGILTSSGYGVLIFFPLWSLVSAGTDTVTLFDVIDILLGPAYNLLKDKLDWNNPEGDRYPFDLSKPLPLQGHPGHLTVAADDFFNNDLEYLKSSDPKRTYTMSITKTKAVRYEIEGIED